MVGCLYTKSEKSRKNCRKINAENHFLHKENVYTKCGKIGCEKIKQKVGKNYYFSALNFLRIFRIDISAIFLHFFRLGIKAPVVYKLNLLVENLWSG